MPTTACVRHRAAEPPPPAAGEDTQRAFSCLERQEAKIRELQDRVLEDPETREDYDANDAVLHALGRHSERYVACLADAYGKVPTDELLQRFDDYVPPSVLDQIRPEEWETEIGRALKLRLDRRQRMRARFDALVGRSFCGDLDAELEAKDGAKVSACAATRDGTYLVDFWASWCGSCRTFNRTFKTEYAHFKQQGIDVIGIATMDERDAYAVAARRDDVPWPVYFDPNERLASALGLTSVPFQLIVHAGKIEAIVDADRTSTQLRRYLVARQ